MLNLTSLTCCWISRRFKGFFTICALGVVAGFVLIAGRLLHRGFAKEVPLEPRQGPQDREIQKIALVGDSWVAGRKLDERLILALAERGIAATVTSFGQPGAKTDEVYRNLFKQGTPHEVLFGKEPYDFVVIVAGVNDAKAYMGADYYAHHVCLSACAVATRGSVPVIVELPEFGLEELDVGSALGALGIGLRRAFYHGGVGKLIPKYRKALSESLARSPRLANVRVVDFDQISVDHRQTPEFYKSDFIHLSGRGNEMLVSAIAKVISEPAGKRSSGMARTTEEGEEQMSYRIRE